MHEPTTLVIFGATGDLMIKKLIPALYNLYSSGGFPEQFKIIGFSRRDWNNEEFRNFIRQNDKMCHICDEGGFEEKFLEYFDYHKGDFSDIEHFGHLKNHINGIDELLGVETNKIFYFSVQQQFYLPIAQCINSMEYPRYKTKLVLEKPYGLSEFSAIQLDNALKQMFTEEQIYRIDHYLGKDILKNIMTLRFKNSMFEPLWNRHHVRKIEITTVEDFGVETRGAFYDSLGALKDVGQNHLLQMLALVTMDKPFRFSADVVRKERADVLGNLRSWTDENVRANTYRAQYKGYRSIEDVRPDSDIETFFALKTIIDTDRWANVPIILKAGKKLSETRKEIKIYFDTNVLHFSFGLKEGIHITFLAGEIGQEIETSFDLQISEKPDFMQYVGEYSSLIHDVIAGDSTYFVSFDEILNMWKFVDPIRAAWDTMAFPLYEYEPGSDPHTNF